MRAYDARDRLLTVDYPGTSADKHFEFYLDGKLHKALRDASGSQPASTWIWQYNHRGLLTSEALAMAGHSFVLGYGYNARGQRDRITYPALGQVDLAPDAMGRPTKLGVYADAIAYDRWGEVTSLVYGNGVTMAASRNSRGLRSHTSYALGASPLTDRNLAYDPNGNLASITDAVKGSACAGADTLFCNGFEWTGYAGTGDWAYAYDALDRLLEVSNPYAADAFSYDPLGNLRSASELGTWTYDAHNRIDTRGGHSYIYDPRGNVTSDGTRSFVWSAANALTNTVGPYANTSYAYDAHGWRIKRQRAGQYPEYYVYNHAHQLMLSWDGSTNRATEYVHLGNLVVAKLHRLATQYILPDWHGSPLLVTNPWGGVTTMPIYLGYGRTDTTGRQQVPGYTGAVMDANTGSTYLGARYLYHKRFTSPDPAPLNPLSPFGLNRYAYANDNPVRNIDPDGRKCRQASDGKAGGCWNTPEETEAAKKGDWRSYYHLAGDKGNDPYAKRAGNVASNSGEGLEGVLDQVTNKLLERAIVKNLSPVVPSNQITSNQVANTMERIRVGLARARVDLLKTRNASSSNPVQMTRRDAANFHRALFEANGVPGSAFGGAAFDSMFGDAGRYIYDWCPPPSCAP